MAAVTVSVVIEQEQIEKIDDLARQQDRSRSSMMRLLIDRGLATEERIALTDAGARAIEDTRDVVAQLKEALQQARDYPEVSEAPADTDEV